MKRGFFKNIKENKFIKKIIFFSPLIPFIVVNFIIALTFSIFIDLSIYYKLTLFTVGFLLSLFILKSEYWFKIDNEESFRKDIPKAVKEFKRIKLSKWNKFIFLIRFLFFNFCKEMFLVLIFWTLYIGSISLIFYLLGKMTLIKNFTDLSSIIFILGVLFGLFTYDVERRERNIKEKITNKLTQLFTNFLEELSFENFLKFLKKRNEILYNKVTSTLNIPSTRPILLSLKEERRGNISFIYPIHLLNYPESLYFSILEGLKEVNELKREYKNFLREKKRKIKTRLETQLPLEDLRRVYLSNYYFLEESYYSFISLLSISKKNYEELSFLEIKQEVMDELIEYLIFNKILGIKEKNET